MPNAQPEVANVSPEHRLTAGHALFSAVLQQLLHAPMAGIDATITEALGQVGQFCKVDRAYVFRLNPQGTIDNTHEWVAEGIAPMIGELQGMSPDRIGVWRRDLDAGGAVELPDVAGLPADHPTRDFLLMQGIRSMLLVPMIFDGRLIGLAGFDAVRASTTFLPPEIYLLRAFADAIGSVLLRRDAETAVARTQGSLQLSVQRQAAILQAMPELLLELDAGGTYLRAHAVDPELYALDESRLIGRTIEDVLPADIAARCRKVMQDIVEKGRVSGFTYPLPTPDGLRWYELSGSLSPPEHPADSPGYLMVVRDVTARMDSAAELRRLGKIVEMMTNLVIVVDERSCIVWANPAFERQTGYALAEVAGRRLADVLRGPDSRADVVAEVRAAMAAGHGYSGENINYDRFGNPYWISFNMHPLHDVDGSSMGYVSVETVTTEQKLLARSLQAERDFLTALMETSVSAVVAFAADGHPVFANAEAGRILNCDTGDLAGLSRILGAARMDPSPGAGAGLPETPVQIVQRTGSPVRDMRCAITGAGGERRILSVNAAAVSGAGNAAQVVCAFTDITELVLAQEALGRSMAQARHQADHDDTTGLTNRRYFNRVLQTGLETARASGDRLAVIVLDLDNFKSINDGFGHAAGDAVLVRVADRLRAVLPAGVTLSRIGGDEFLCLLPAADACAAAALATGLRHAVAPPMQVDGMRVYTTASLGISMFPDHGADVDTLIKHADQAMYAAKAAGRNRHEFFTPEQSRLLQRRSAILQALRDSLDSDHFRLVFQPKFALGPSQRLVGAEALLRWTSPVLGEVGPAEFIPVAEASAMIVDIDFRVMVMFATQLGAWVAQGYRPAASLNLSAQTFENPDLAERLLGVLDYHRIPADLVTVEITEGSLVSMNAMAMENIRRIHAAGIALSVDDFGTGYSSFTYLQRLTIDEVKIDRSFVEGIGGGGERAGSEAIIRAILAMARAMGITSVAEGVETLAQMTWLHAEGCDQVQGFKSGRPQDPASFEHRYLAPQRLPGPREVGLR